MPAQTCTFTGCFGCSEVFVLLSYNKICSVLPSEHLFELHHKSLYRGTPGPNGVSYHNFLHEHVDSTQLPSISSPIGGRPFRVVERDTDVPASSKLVTSSFSVVLSSCIMATSNFSKTSLVSFVGLPDLGNRSIVPWSVMCLSSHHTV